MAFPTETNMTSLRAILHDLLPGGTEFCLVVWQIEGEQLQLSMTMEGDPDLMHTVLDDIVRDAAANAA